ncbi:MAG TPA: glutamate-cysteine ligase family protein [Polyangiaceae bacterium]
MATPTSADDDRPIRGLADLISVFEAAEKPPERALIGVEAEKFAVHAPTGAPLSYDGERSVARIFDALAAFGWVPERESERGPVIALRRGPASITLEPGSQLELSGAALSDLHAARAEFVAHLGELRAISSELELAWLGVGFHPLARQAELGWVPKQRYAVMKEYLPTRGYAAHDMMRRTATVQANYDYTSEADALKKLVVSLKLSPLIHAMTAHAPFAERRRSEHASLRGEVWLHMDPARSGLIAPLWSAPSPGYADYAEWALDAGMFLFKRGERVYGNTGQTFRDFWKNGFEGEHATIADWRLHLNTLFPEARLKNTVEVRGCDAQRLELSMAIPAIFTGFLYDERALDEASELVRGFDYETMEAARPALVRDALRASIGGTPARALAERLIDIALGGLDRRAKLDASGSSERAYLEPLAALVARGECPADETAKGLAVGANVDTAELVERTRLA